MAVVTKNHAGVRSAWICDPICSLSPDEGFDDLRTLADRRLADRRCADLADSYVL